MATTTELTATGLDDVTLTPNSPQTDVSRGNTSQSTSPDDCVICDYQISAAMKAVRVALGIGIMVANGITVLALLRSKSLQMALKAFLVNIALADALLGLSFTYLTVVVDVWTEFSLECRVRYGALSYLQLVTLYSILVFSAEKVITLARPFSSSQLLTKKTLSVTLTLLWVLPVVMTAVAYEMRDSRVTECYFGRFTGTEAFLIFAVSNVIAVVLVVLCQIVIFVMAKNQVNKIASTMVGDSAAQKMTRMNFRVAVTTLVVVAPFLLLSTPLLGGYLFLAINPEYRHSKDYLPVITTEFIFTILNCIVDPIVFCLRLKAVRLELKKIGRTMTFGKCCDDIINDMTLTSS